jgi:hypothetical protein
VVKSRADDGLVVMLSWSCHQPFKQMENISNFLRACRALGVPEPDLFETVDLFEEKDISLVVRCLDSLVSDNPITGALR